MYRGPLFPGAVQGGAQFDDKLRPNHPEKTQAGFPGDRGEVRAALSSKVQDVEGLVDNQAGRGIVAKHNPVSLLLHIEPHRSFPFFGLSGLRLRIAGRDVKERADVDRFLRVDPVLPVRQCEEIGESADRFRLAQDQVSGRLQGVVEDRHYLFLEHRSHVDQDVPAADEVYPGERGVLRKILACENAHFTDRLVDLVASVRLDEESAQTLRAYVGEAAIGVNGGACPFDRGLADVGAEYLDRCAIGLVAEVFHENDRHGIRLLTGRAARHPDADGLVSDLAVHDFRQEHIPQRFE